MQLLIAEPEPGSGDGRASRTCTNANGKSSTASRRRVAAACSYLLGGLLLDRTSPRVAFLTAGAAGLLATGATTLALRRATT